MLAKIGIPVTVPPKPLWTLPFAFRLDGDLCAALQAEHAMGRRGVLQATPCIGGVPLQQLPLRNLTTQCAAEQTDSVHREAEVQASIPHLQVFQPPQVPYRS